VLKRQNFTPGDFSCHVDDASGIVKLLTALKGTKSTFPRNAPSAPYLHKPSVNRCNLGRLRLRSRPCLILKQPSIGHITPTIFTRPYAMDEISVQNMAFRQISVMLALGNFILYVR
jgi:hypothetical protein